MWPVRSRRGTRKRCAAVFLVGLCAAIMIISRPFVGTLVDPPPAVQLPEPLGVLAPLNDSTTDNSSSRLPSTSEKIELAPPPALSIVIKPEFILEPASLVEEEVTYKSSSALEEESSTQTATSSSFASSPSPVNSGPLMAAPTPAGRRPLVYVLTPTFPRMEQMAELTRLGQTLMLIKDLHWLVVDDVPHKSAEVERLLRRTAIPYTYLVAQMPEAYRKKKGSKPKGVANRLAGLKWIKANALDNGVMFFADDDNSYDIRLFEEMRWTKKVSMWPVGLVTQLGVSTPVVRDGRVVDFYDGWISTRKFPVDMAGFAVNVGFLKTRPNVTMPYKAGFEEDGFLRSLNISINDIEPKADNCTKIYVWHTKTVGNKTPQKLSAKDRKRFNNTNLFSLPHIV